MKKRLVSITLPLLGASCALGFALRATATTAVASVVSPAKVRVIARDACIYGYPLVDNYRIQYSYFVDKQSPEFKGGWRAIHNNVHVYALDDEAMQPSNSDMPYS